MTPRTSVDPESAPSRRPSVPETSAALRVRDLGRTAYAEALAIQRELQREVIERRRESPDLARDDLTRDATHGDGRSEALGHLLLVEHDPPVITVSRRKTARQHLVATPEMLARAGIEVAETDRGGDITYHGPGQLVVYPILDLNRLNLRLHSYMRLLERIVINVLARWNIRAECDESATGVWVRTNAFAGPMAPADGTPPHQVSKICAMGVRVSRWVSMHGLALNVTTDLEHFRLIVPCGLADRTVTSMSQLLGTDCPSMEEIKRAMVEEFARATDSSAAFASTA